eukprot:scaffold169134_cov18-Tisochrysis_lutea.AAC.1
MISPSNFHGILWQGGSGAGWVAQKQHNPEHYLTAFCLTKVEESLIKILIVGDAHPWAGWRADSFISFSKGNIRV